MSEGADARAVEPLARPPDTTVPVPGSRSITNRALVCAALADGTSRLEGALRADDTEAMVDCLGSLGVGVDWRDDTITVEGCAGVPPVKGGRLHTRLSGTTSRFVVPLAALGHGRFTIDADPPMRRRPMGPQLEALRRLGVDVTELAEPGHLPVEIDARGVRGGSVSLSGDVSSQFVSGLLMAAPCFRDGVSIEVTSDLVSEPFVEMTRSVMAAFGVEVDGLSVRPSAYSATTYRVEPDAATASYFFAAAAITGGTVTVDGIGRSSLQGDAGVVEVLRTMGADVEQDGSSTTVRGTSSLHGVDVDLRHLSDMVPTIAVVAPFADSPTTITGVGFIRRKESDRIAAVVTELRRCGVDAEELDDGLRIHPGSPHGAIIETYDDHRIAMAFAVLGLRVPGIRIADPGCVAKTVPSFFETLELLR